MSLPLMRAQRNLLADIFAGSPVKVDALSHPDGARSLAASLAFLVRKGQIEDTTPADADVREYSICAEGKTSLADHDAKITAWMDFAEDEGIPVTRDEATMKDIADKCSGDATKDGSKQAVRRLRKLAVAAGWVDPKAGEKEEEKEAVAASVSADEPEGETTDEPRARKIG